MSLRDLWSGLSRPEGAAQTHEARAATACGHALIGLAAGAVAPWWGVAALYLIGKEFADWRAGGGWRDGVIDTAFVAAGAALAGVAWGPAALLVLAGLDGAYGDRIRRRAWRG